MSIRFESSVEAFGELRDDEPPHDRKQQLLHDLKTAWLMAKSFQRNRYIPLPAKYAERLNKIATAAETLLGLLQIGPEDISAATAGSVRLATMFGPLMAEYDAALKLHLAADYQGVHVVPLERVPIILADLAKAANTAAQKHTTRIRRRSGGSTHEGGSLKARFLAIIFEVYNRARRLDPDSGQQIGFNKDLRKFVFAAFADASAELSEDEAREFALLSSREDVRGAFRRWHRAQINA
jgi:hypothetical protein